MSILDNQNNQEHDLYIRALKSLEKHNQYSEHVKEPNTKEERAFMHETNKAVSSSSFAFSIPQERYTEIFGEKHA